MIKEIIESIIAVILKFFKNKKSGDAFTDQVEIIYMLDRLIHDDAMANLNIERAVVIKCHNDGDEIMPLSYKYFSVIYEDFRKPFKSVRNKYKGISVDKEYVLMISKMYQNKTLAVTVEEMPECMMKDIYTVEGIKFTQMFFVKHTKRGYWYLSVSTSQKGETFSTPLHRSELYLVVNKIRRLLKQY